MLMPTHDSWVSVLPLPREKDIWSYHELRPIHRSSILTSDRYRTGLDLLVACHCVGITIAVAVESGSLAVDVGAFLIFVACLLLCNG